MKYYIVEEHQTFARVVQTLGKFAAKQAQLSKDGTRYKVYRTKAAFKDGFEYTSYELIGGKLKKTKSQPIAYLNRLLLSRESA
jgi:hypothetical protein